MPLKDPEARKAYHREYMKTYFKNNPEAKRKHQETVSRNTAAARQRLREKVWEYLKDRACVDCGESDVVVLEFDHRDPELKVLDVSTMVSNRHSWTDIIAEIEKCDVRCANCHRRKTASQFGWHQG